MSKIYLQILSTEDSHHISGRLVTAVMQVVELEVVWSERRAQGSTCPLPAGGQRSSAVKPGWDPACRPVDSLSSYWKKNYCRHVVYCGSLRQGCRILQRPGVQSIWKGHRRSSAEGGKGVSSGKRAQPPPGNFLYFLYQNGEFLCILGGGIYWQCNCSSDMFWTYIF